jgi:DNA primase
MISKETIQKIKQIPIKDIISQYTTIKNNKAICPIHHGDTNPSLVIYEKTNSFYCFGCNVGGDVIEFIEQVEGIKFSEAIQKLINDKNIEPEYITNINYSEDLVKLIQKLKENKNEKIFDEKILEKYNIKHRYLIDMGFKKETLEYFQIGYCDDENDELFNRITIPWRDSNGNLIGIIGRDITNKSNAKYIAKKGSEKQQHLFNLWNAKYYGKKYLILTEDEKSILRLWEWGFYNAVALGNSGLKERKWLLRKYTPCVYLCLDNDEPGEKATEKIIKEISFLIKIYKIPFPIYIKDIAELPDKKLWLECLKRKEKIN